MVLHSFNIGLYPIAQSDVATWWDHWSLLWEHDIVIVKEFHGLCISAMFPHHRKEPDAALADAKIGWGKSHFGIERRFIALRIVLCIPPKCLSLPCFIFLMQLKGKCTYFVQTRNGDWNGQCIVPVGVNLNPNCFHAFVAPVARHLADLVAILPGCAQSRSVHGYETVLIVPQR